MKLTDVILGDNVMGPYIEWVNRVNFDDISNGFDSCKKRGRYFEIVTNKGRVHKVPCILAKNPVYLLFLFSWGIAKSTVTTKRLADLL